MEYKKFAVLGLGSFGHHVARTLGETGHDVLAIDIDPAAVEKATEFCSRAVVADVSEKEELAQTGVRGVDIAVVAFGTRIDFAF